MMVGEEPGTVAAGRIPGEVNPGRVAVELGERFVHLHKRRLATGLLPAGCAVGVSLCEHDDYWKSVRVQPDCLRQRAHGGPDTIRAILATAMQGQYDRPCPPPIVIAWHVDLVSVLYFLDRHRSVKKA